VGALADVTHPDSDVAASIASGSFITDGMIVAPCSIKTLSGIANCYDENLIVRAADVCLKERRRLVLVVRETPLHLGHLRLMVQATEAGAVVFPLGASFYPLAYRVLEVIGRSGAGLLREFWSELA